MSGQRTHSPSGAWLGLVGLVSTICFLAFASVSWAEGKSRSVVLPAHGGVKVDVPGWNLGQQTTDSVVLKRTGEDKSTDQAVLTVVSEAGPPDPTKVEWQAVRKEIERAARSSGSELNLEVGNAWQKTDGFLGRVMKGTLVRGAKAHTVELVALAGPRVFVTIAMLSPKWTADLSQSLTDCARSVSRLADR